MRRVETKQLKSAHTAFQANPDAAQLLAVILDDWPDAQEDVEPQSRPAAPGLTVNDLRLVCWEYGWAQAGFSHVADRPTRQRKRPPAGLHPTLTPTRCNLGLSFQNWCQ